MNKEKLVGGNMSTVYREGNLVYRERGDWSPTIHRFLIHLEKMGFTKCPQFIGELDEKTEILTYVEGTTLSEYPNAQITQEVHLKGIVSLAKIMKQFHEASSSFLRSDADIWMLEYLGNLPKEVICHNDIGFYNMTFKENIPYKMIDFDTCCPAPRIWDIVYALYSFIPITNEKQSEAYIKKCIHTFFENYDMEFPENFFLIMIERLQALIKTITDKAEAGDKAFLKMVEDGHDKFYWKEIEIIKQRFF